MSDPRIGHYQIVPERRSRLAMNLDVRMINI
jgi:hypothetical protein